MSIGKIEGDFLEGINKETMSSVWGNSLRLVWNRTRRCSNGSNRTHLDSLLGRGE